MNINEWARSYMSINQHWEPFYLHVVSCIERQLMEWNEGYEEVIVLCLGNTDYQLLIQNQDKIYSVTLTKYEIEFLQKCDPYALDRVIWRNLEEQGLPIIRGFGNYIDYVVL